MLTVQEAKKRARRLYRKIAIEAAFDRPSDTQIQLIADELIRVASEARHQARSRIADGTYDELTIVMVDTEGFDGWANLVLDRERRYIAAIPPPIAAVLMNHVRLEVTSPVEEAEP